MGKRLVWLITALLALLSAAATPSFALTITVGDVTGEFSPNGDGAQDVCSFRYSVEDDVNPVLTVGVGIYTVPDEAPDVAHRVRAWADETPDALEFSSGILIWDGRDDGGAPLPDGVYYLQIRAETAEETVWFHPTRTIMLNSAAATLVSLSLDPHDVFEPLADSAGELRVYFDSHDFDPELDFAYALFEKWRVSSAEWIEIAEAHFDPDYVASAGGVPRYRILWDGGVADEAVEDGSYRATVTIGDDAGNGSDTGTPLHFYLDAAAPVLNLYDLGEVEIATGIISLPPALLPDSLILAAVDFSGVAACSLCLSADSVFTVAGDWHGEAGDTTFFRFDLPRDDWVAQGDSLHKLIFTSEDLLGHSGRDLEGYRTIRLLLDGTPPPDPVWNMPVTDFVQAGVQLRGTCAEDDVEIILSVDGVEFAILEVTLETMSWTSSIVLLEEGSHVWTVQARDAAGNLSPNAPSITLTYTPGPTVRIPGRFRGRTGEEIFINTAEPAAEIIVRIYTLEGDLVRLIDFNAASQTIPEYRRTWDLKDEEGNWLMDGLYVMNIAITERGGATSCERKVVAIVRD